MVLSLHDLAVEAIEIYVRHAEAAEYDAGFDAGEFSGPAHSRVADDKVAALAAEHGTTFSKVRAEMESLCCRI